MSHLSRPASKTTLLKVVILGDGGVGKSCLMNRFVSNRYDENNFHTIGVEFMNKDIEVDGEKYILQIWDTAGQERFRALRTPFYRGSDICILCYAINDRESLNGLKNWRNEFLTYADVQIDKFPFIVVGNKNDMAARYRQINYEEVKQWCDENKICSIIETSSKAATNVTDAFVMAVRQWKHMECIAEKESRQQGETIDLTKTIHLAKNRFCCSGAPSSATTRTYDADSDDEFVDESQIDVKPSPRRFGRVRQKSAQQQSTNYEL